MFSETERESLDVDEIFGRLMLWRSKPKRSCEKFFLCGIRYDP
jgi:hypothetical protein